MNYLYIAIGVYVTFGAILTHSVMSGMHKPRRRLRDWVLGSVSMPVLFAVGLICIAAEKIWARLLPLLDFEKPEELRAGPVDPATRKSATDS